MTIHLKDDDQFRRVDQDVISTVRVHPTTLVLGGEVVADTLEGKRIKLKVKPARNQEHDFGFQIVVSVNQMVIVGRYLFNSK
ncbi:hypothetical protein OVA29_18295 [Exiguobacterium sp. SL14]|nr:DnaJ C-terminal domain-containing protein [Exiguobacterium sp. SL14]MCY1692279.1 hypothetical protein [Exiguobacterium sp. SL14]